MCRRRVFALTSLLLAQLLLPAFAQDGLIDLARREKLRRDSIRIEVPRFTNQDLDRLQQARVSVGDEGKNDAVIPGPVRKQVENTAEKTRLQLWSSMLLSAQERLSAAVNHLHVLQLRHNHLRNLYLNSTDEIQRMRLEASLREVLMELKQAETEESDARKAWLVIQDEATIAGLNPGREPLRAVIIEEVPDAEKP